MRWYAKGINVIGDGVRAVVMKRGWMIMGWRGYRRILGGAVFAAFLASIAGGQAPVVADALGGTLARDHQSRAMYYEGQHRRTYLTYLRHDFEACVTYYDHDSGQWAEPVRVDNCIAEVGWCKDLKDGHNAPNLWVSHTGTIHLIYGSHGTPFKYARSVRPESIDEWELGARLSNYATYPFVAELPSGELLMFHRYGPQGGYKNPFLGVLRSMDDGRTWSEVEKLGAFRQACKLNGENAVYDPASGRIHLNLALMPEGSWASYACQFDPAASRLYSWDGKTDLGALPGDDLFVEHGRVDGLTLREIFVNHGTLFFLLQRGDAHSFAVWDGETLARYDIPGSKMAGFTSGPIWTRDNTHLFIYGARDTEPATPFSGKDLYVWTSADGGRTWDDGRRLIDRRTLGHGIQGVNRVMNYPGHGPFLIVCEATGTYSDDFEVTPQNHYDNPWRKNKRIYALDEQGRFID
ncbi:MAG: BNR-4 repeat-containing protein [Candidatus Hydrogenedentes bacterium]|nr:BNR-4 repeat-containing protein [Candidatus Hydrogenedentota bacterium]